MLPSTKKHGKKKFIIVALVLGVLGVLVYLKRTGKLTLPKIK